MDSHEHAIVWLSSSATWLKFALLALACLAARAIAGRLSRMLIRTRAPSPKDDAQGVFSSACRLEPMVLPLMLPLIAYELTVTGENLTRTMVGSGEGIAGSLLFWLGTWSNRQLACNINAKQALRPATRELAAKVVEVLIFGAAFLLLMSIMGIDLTAIEVLGGALAVGIGPRLPQIAANVIWSIILLVDGQSTVREDVELDGAEKGASVKRTARACVLDTFDDKWMGVPDEHAITRRVINGSDQDRANRKKPEFRVSDDTDIKRLPAIIEAAVSALAFVLKHPNGPNCEVSGFGGSFVDFVVTP